MEFVRMTLIMRIHSCYRDQLSWIQSILALVSSDDLAFDVAGAEALLDRHQVSK